MFSALATPEPSPSSIITPETLSGGAPAAEDTPEPLPENPIAAFFSGADTILQDQMPYILGADDLRLTAPGLFLEKCLTALNAVRFTAGQLGSEDGNWADTLLGDYAGSGLLGVAPGGWSFSYTFSDSPPFTVPDYTGKTLSGSLSGECLQFTLNDPATPEAALFTCTAVKQENSYLVRYSETGGGIFASFTEGALSFAFGGTDVASAGTYGDAETLAKLTATIEHGAIAVQTPAPTPSPSATPEPASHRRRTPGATQTPASVQTAAPAEPSSPSAEQSAPPKDTAQ